MEFGDITKHVSRSFLTVCGIWHFWGSLVQHPWRHKTQESWGQWYWWSRHVWVSFLRHGFCTTCQSHYYFMLGCHDQKLQWRTREIWEKVSETIAYLDEPLVMVASRPWLSQWNLVLFAWVVDAKPNSWWLRAPVPYKAMMFMEDLSVTIKAVINQNETKQHMYDEISQNYMWWFKEKK